MAFQDIGFRIYHPEKKVFVSNGKPIVSLRDAPPGYRIHRKYCRLNLEITQAAAAAGVSSVELTKTLDTIKIGKRVRASGLLLSHMDWIQSGKDFNIPAATPAGAGVFTRSIAVVVNYADPSAYNPADTSPNTEFYDDTPIEVAFGKLDSVWSDYTPAKYTSVTGELITTLDLDVADPGVVPTPIQINYDDWSGKTLLFGPGTYRCMFVYKEDGTNIAAADITGIDLAVDGDKILDDVDPAELAMLFNHSRAKGVDTGEAAPGDTSWPFVPLIVPAYGYKLTKLPHAERNIRVDFKGTATSFRVAYSMVENSSIETKVKAAAKLGIDTAGTVAEAKTIAKTNVQRPRFFSLLPTKFKRA